MQKSSRTHSAMIIALIIHFGFFYTGLDPIVTDG
jgi:hypothetical protein